MATKIIWSPTAIKSYLIIQQYINLNWNAAIGDLFEKKVLKKIDQLTLFPASAPRSKQKPNIRKVVITKHTSLIYKWSPRKKEIELLVFWDNRQIGEFEP